MRLTDPFSGLNIDRWYKFVLVFFAVIFLIFLAKPLPNYIGVISLSFVVYSILVWWLADQINIKYEAKTRRWPRIPAIDDHKDLNELAEEWRNIVIAVTVVLVVALALLLASNVQIPLS